MLPPPSPPGSPHPCLSRGKKWANCFLPHWALLCFGFVGSVWGELVKGGGRRVRVSEFPAENESRESAGLDEMGATSLSATLQPEVKGESLK